MIAPPAAWRRTLRSVVSRLRHGLAAAGWPAWDPIRSTFDAYALSCDTRLWVDAPCARRAVSTAEVALAAGELGRAATAGGAAWQLARRAPVPSGDSSFGQRLARSMADTAYRAAMVTARAWVLADDPVVASQFARAAVDVAPHREDGWRLLLEAHGRRDDLGAVAAAFDEMTAMFEAELGVSPHATTFALYRRLVGVPRASVPTVAAAPGGR